MKKTALIILLLLSNASFAISFAEARVVYQRLTASNHLEALPLILRQDGEINADTNGIIINVNSGLLRAVKNQDEMALVLGHELAHAALHHQGSTPTRELAADRLGAKYSAHAGYSICKGAQLFKRFNSPASSTHPASAERVRRLGCKL